MSSWKERSSFQGRGWQPRRAALSEEIAGDRRIWAPWRVASEHAPLEAVLLYRPGAEVESIADPNQVQHLATIELAALKREHDGLAAAFRRLGVQVRFIARRFSSSRWPAKQNLMFVRDLFFNTLEGAIVARMASTVRAGEEKHVSFALSSLAVPINKTISGAGTFEGADALWLDARTVLCGVGGRTNREGLRQLRSALKPQGVEVVAVELPSGAQHLLGLLQIVDRNLAFARRKFAHPTILRLLRGRGFGVVLIDESDEVVKRQGMNAVTLRPRTIIMPGSCPKLRRTYERAGVAVAAEVDISQIIRAAGGLACATGILARETRDHPA